MRERTNAWGMHSRARLIRVIRCFGDCGTFAENDLEELIELGAVEHAALVGVAHGHQLHDLLVARRRQVDIGAPGSAGRAMDAEEARVGGWGQGKGRGWGQG